MSPRGTIISVGGPPHSGKSVLVNLLNRLLVQSFGDEVFLERANPDGEGNPRAAAGRGRSPQPLRAACEAGRTELRRA